MRPSHPFRSFALLVLPIFAACADPIAPPPQRPATVLAPHARYAPVVLDGVPHVKQKPDFCGEACIEMALARLGKPMSQDHIFALTGVDPSLGRGAYTKEMKAALAKLGFETGPVWHTAPAKNAEAAVEARFAEMHADLLQGIPSIVCMHYSDAPGTTEHFRLVLGYDDKTDEVLYNEPAEAGGGYRRMTRARFNALWPLKYDASQWTVIRLRLDPAPMVAAGFSPPPAPGVKAAAYAQHILALRHRVPQGFSVVSAPPFVVVGDETPEVVRARANSTVNWAVEKLKQDFFDADPKEILDVWLFRSKPSYDKYTRSIFGDKPTTPYGYYSSQHKALIMNIATGGGTLVHEIVHPFVEADFPGAPAWLNEGLGSLFEQSGEEDGHIVGYPNWRLPSLKEAIGRGMVPSFKELTSTTEDQFYHEDPGTNYAQSRYLCYYLQEKRLLVKFYKAFRAARASDPTGYETLQKVLGEKDMDAFKQRWEQWVLRIRYPG